MFLLCWFISLSRFPRLLEQGQKPFLRIMLMCCGVAYPQHVEHIKEKHFEGMLIFERMFFVWLTSGR